MILRLFLPSAVASSLAEVDLDDLAARGINSLILDLDNTIAPWQRYEIPEDIAKWLTDAQSRGMKLCIASNTRNSKRLNTISERLSVYSVCRALKPRRWGFLSSMKLMGSKPSVTAVIGDQLLTDICGGNRLGIYTILVSPLHRREFIGTKVSRIFEWLILGWFRARGLLGTKPERGQSERKERA
jgi:uncharacterized protein